MDETVYNSIVNTTLFLTAEEDDEEEFTALFLAHSMFTDGGITTRNPSSFDQRLNWAKLISTKKSKRNFKTHLRMSVPSFEKFLNCIRDDLLVNQEMAMRRGGAIIPELCLYCTIRWLAGGAHSDIFFYLGISKASFYRLLWKTITAIIRCNDECMKISFPKTRDECDNLARGFKQISTNGCIDNCVSVVDGYLLTINVPTKKEAKNVRSFFSGHYKTYGVNIQAACDYSCRFTFIGIAGPGSMGDRESSKRCGLFNLMENLPDDYTAIGDCAYQPTEHMVPIYGGNDAKNQQNDTFNYFASQLRIRIEMAFGLMVKKWGILQRSSLIKLDNLKYMVIAIGRLHNFCINERIEENSLLQMLNDKDQYEMSESERRRRTESSDEEFEEYASIWRGQSKNRELMKRKIIELKLTRPIIKR